MLVRSLWRAEVELAPWIPQFEIAHLRAIPVEAWAAHLWIDDGFAAIFWRAFAEAGLRPPTPLKGGTRLMSIFNHNIYDNVRTRAMVLHGGCLLLRPH